MHNTQKRATGAESGRTTRLLPILLAPILTLLTRLWFVLGMRGHPFSTIGPQMVDSYYYHRWAIEIISGSFWGSDVFFLRPLYPYLLAPVYAVFGVNILPVQLLQVLLSSVSCLLLYDSTRRLFGRRPATIASFGFALTGVLVFYTGTLLYVETTILLSLLFLWLILIAAGRFWVWILASISFGLLVICRPELLLLLPFLLWWLWKRPVASGPKPDVSSPSSETGVRRRGLVAMAVAAILVIAVVPIRNYIVARDPVLFTAHSGINFFYGNNPAADGTWRPTAELERGPGFSHERLKRVSRNVEGRELRWSEASAYWTRQGLRFIFSQPLDYLRLLGRKFLLFLSSYEVPNNYYPETARAASLPLRLAFVNYGLVLAFGLLGMVWAWPQRSRVLPVYLLIAAYLVSALLFYVLSRLRTPVIPFLLMFAGFGLNELAGAFGRRRAVRAGTGVAVVVGVYLLSALLPIQRQTYSAQAWTQEGNTYLSRRETAPAIAAFRRALAVHPGAYAARYSLVMALAGSGNVEQAEAEFAQAAKYGTSSSEGRALARLAAARVAIARRDFRRAAELYSQDLAEYPDNAETHYLLGLVYISMNNLVSARELLTLAVSLDPGHEAARDALKAVESHLLR